MSKQTEMVVARDEYTVGMRVRLRNGETCEVDVDRGDGYEYPLLVDSGGSRLRSGSYIHGQEDPYDIIGEVVTAAAPKVATNAVGFMADEGRLYDDGMHTRNGKVDGMTLEEAMEARRYADRAISRLRRDAKHYKWRLY